MGIANKPGDVTRAERKAKRRKLEDAVPDLPGDVEIEIANDIASSHTVGNDKKRKRNDNTHGSIQQRDDTIDKQERKRVKKERKGKTDPLHTLKIEETHMDGSGGAHEESAIIKASPDSRTGGILLGLPSDEPRKSKKERKAERKAKEAIEKAQQLPSSIKEPAGSTSDHQVVKAVEETNAKSNNPIKDQKYKKERHHANAEKGDGKDPRFIVFIGNLPFSATKASVTKHFAAVKPKSVRHLTQKDNPSKSKGIAFVEFDGYDHMKTCLKLFHHSNFDDGISPARKINVELTAGGGGNTKERKEKIKEKNVKLNDQRFRRIQEEEKVKWEKKNESGGVDESGIHPSRRRFMGAGA